MPKMTVCLALTYLFFLLGGVIAVYFFFIYPMMKSSYENVTNKLLPTFIVSLMTKNKKVPVKTGATQASTARSPTAEALSPRKYTATEWTAKPRTTSTSISTSAPSSLLGQSY